MTKLEHEIIKTNQAYFDHMKDEEIHPLIKVIDLSFNNVAMNLVTRQCPDGNEPCNCHNKFDDMAIVRCMRCWLEEYEEGDTNDKT